MNVGKENINLNKSYKHFSKILTKNVKCTMIKSLQHAMRYCKESPCRNAKEPLCSCSQGKMMKHIKRKKSLQASTPANILSQLETSLLNKQVNISSLVILMY